MLWFALCPDVACQHSTINQWSSIKFVGGNHYHQQMNMITFWAKLYQGLREQDTTENLNRRQTVAAT